MYIPSFKAIGSVYLEKFFFQVFCSPEPKAPGKLMYRLAPSSVRPVSNDFSSETTGPIATKFHIQPPGPLGKKIVQMVWVT